MVNRDEFEGELRRALNHFYNPQILRNSPLIEWLGVRDADAVERLRTILRRSIEALCPRADVPDDTREQRFYDVLYNRYIRRWTQQSEAARLGITVRHLRREQAAALAVLADYVLLQFDLLPGSDAMVGAAPPLSLEARDNAEMNREMLWLADSQRYQTCLVKSVLQEAVELTRPLIKDQHVTVGVECAEGISEVAIPGTVLQQIVLNLLTAEISNLTRGGSIWIAAREGEGRVVLSVAAAARSHEAWEHKGPLESALLMSQQLAELFDGRLTCCDVGDTLVVQIVVPRSQPKVTVLAIEDNVETLRLWSRYLRGTPFNLVGQSDPSGALLKAIEIRPRLILLDVMMPDVDGWTLLRQLRQEPLTSRIPIIVCTVLPQRALALSLGASDFIQKPTMGQDLRSVLERQISAAAPR